MIQKAIILFVVLCVIMFAIMMWDKRAILHANKHPFHNVWSDDDGSGTTYQMRGAVLVSKSESLFRDNDITMVPMFGTLLGFIRGRGMIPWDYNIDFAINSVEYDKIITLRRLALKEGLILENKGDHIRITTDGEWPWIRVFRMTKNDKTVYINKNTRDVEIALEDMFPYRSNLFNGVPMRLPNKPDSILSSLYGPNWETECLSASSDPRSGKSYKTRFIVRCFDMKHKWNDLFDNVWVINLLRRKDRWERTSKRLKNIGISPKRWNAVDAKSPDFEKLYASIPNPKISASEAACFMSHKKLWKHIYQIGVPYAIIFEDDIFIPDNVTKKDIVNVLDNSKGFNILFLGYCWSTMSFNIERFTKPDTKSGTGMCLHAYVITRSAIARLIKLANHYSRPIDHITQDFCLDELCFLTKHITTPDTYGSGLILQDLELGSDLRKRGRQNSE